MQGSHNRAYRDNSPYGPQHQNREFHNPQYGLQEPPVQYIQTRDYQSKAPAPYGKTAQRGSSGDGGVSCFCRRWAFFAITVAVFSLFLLIIGFSTTHWLHHYKAGSMVANSGIWQYCNSTLVAACQQHTSTFISDNSLIAVRGLTVCGLFTLFLAILFSLLSLCVPMQNMTAVLIMDIVLYFVTGVVVVIGVCVYAMAFSSEHELAYSFILTTVSAFGAVIAGGAAGLDYVRDKNGR